MRTPRSGGNPLLLRRRPATRPAVRSRIESVDEPGIPADRGAHSDRQILGKLEGLEVVEHDRLAQQPFDLVRRQLLHEDGVSPETRAESRDGGGRAAEGPGDLSMRRAGLEQGRDGEQEFGALHVVSSGERVLGEGAPAGQAPKAREQAAARIAVDRMRPVAVSGLGSEVLGAVSTGAESRLEVLQSLDGCPGPVHGP